jgi:hypothetical protein
MVRLKWISDKISQTKTIIGLAVFVGALAYFFSNESLLIGILGSVITLIGLVVLDLDDRVKNLETWRNNKKGKRQGR